VDVLVAIIGESLSLLSVDPITLLTDLPRFTTANSGTCVFLRLLNCWWKGIIGSDKDIAIGDDGDKEVGAWQ